MPPKKQPQYKGRILFLHGYTQSSSIFYAKTSALRKKLQKLQYKSVYLNGPYKLTPAQLPSADALSKFNSVIPTDEDEETNNRAWWIKKDYHKDPVDITEAVKTINDYIHNQIIIPDSDSAKEEKDAAADNKSDKDLPIVGLVGFSQGAALGGILIHRLKELFNIDSLKFAVLYSGFKIDTSKNSASAVYDDYYTKDGGESDKHIRLLHVYGELDTVVSDDRALSFYDVSKKNSDVLKHPGGHFVPNSKMLIDQVTNWIVHFDTTNQDKDEKDSESNPKDGDKTKNLDDLDSLMDMMDNLGKA